MNTLEDFSLFVDQKPSHSFAKTEIKRDVLFGSGLEGHP
jgi:hypothetical protein